MLRTKLPKKPLTWTFPAGASDFATANEAAKSDKPPADAQKATVDDDEDPAILAERRARSRERRNALFMKLRQLSPALFAAKKPVPPKVGIAEQIIERLALDADTEKERGSDLVGTGLMAHFNIDGVFYFMAAAALLLAALAASRSLTTTAPQHRPFCHVCLDNCSAFGFLAGCALRYGLSISKRGRREDGDLGGCCITRRSCGV